MGFVPERFCMMKKFLMCLLAGMFVVVSGDVLAAKDSKSKSKNKKAVNKVQAGKAVWKTDLKSAMADAVKSKKQIFVLVTGSTWCPPCQNLEKTVLSKPEFAALAARSLVLVKADVPRGAKPAPDAIATMQYINHQGGVPAAYLLSADGKIIDKQVGFGGGDVKSYLSRFKGYNMPAPAKDAKKAKDKKKKK